MEIARQYSNILGPVPHTFSWAVNTLMLDHKAGKECLGKNTEFQMKRLCKGPVFLAVLYYATKTIFRTKLQEGKQMTPLDLVRLYDPYSLAALVALIFLYKRAKRICDPNQWKFIDEPLRQNIELGIVIGSLVPGIGLGPALLGGALIPLAQSAFLSQDLKGFREYRTLLKSKNLVMDPKFEMDRWDCTASEVASGIMVNSGFGAIEAKGLFEGFMGAEAARGKLNETAYRYRLVKFWIQSLRKDQSKAAPVARDDFFPKKSDLADLLDEASEIMLEGSEFEFLTRGKEDITEELAPELFKSAAPAKPEAPELKQQCFYEDLPPEVQAQVPEAEFEQVKHLSLEEIISLFE